MPRPIPFSSVNQILRGLIAQYGFQGPMAEHLLRGQWNEIVGDQIAAHVGLDQIRFRKLYLAVDSAPWMQEMVFLKSALLEKINAALVRFEAGFHVEEIVLRLGSPAAPPPIETAPRAASAA